MTVAGYAGNPRYLVAAAAVGAALAGAGAVRAASALARGARRGAAAGEHARRAAPGDSVRPSRRAAADDAGPSGGATRRLRRAAARGAVRRPHGPAAPSRVAAPLGAAVLVLAVLAVTAGDLRAQTSELGSRAEASSEFAGVLARAGGKSALQRCSRIRTSNRARSLVAWRLDLPLRTLDATPERPAVVLRAKWFYGQGLEPPRTPGYRTLVTSRHWQVIAACGRAPQVQDG
jgi:hypothetical protein